MTSLDEHVLKATKEIVVKFIETGRVSPNGFHDTFCSIYRTIAAAARGDIGTGDTDDADDAARSRS